MRVLVHLCCGPCAITVCQELSRQGLDVTGLFFNPNIQPLAEYLRRREGAARVAERLGIPLIMGDTLPLAEQVWDDPLGRLPVEASAADVTLSAERTTVSPAVGPEGSGRPVSLDALAANADALPGIATASASSPPRNPFPDFPPAVHPGPWLRHVAPDPGNRCPACWYVRIAKTAVLAKRWGFGAFSSSLLYSRYQRHEMLQTQGRDLAAALGVEFVYQDFRLFWQQGIELSKEWGIYRQPYCGCLYSEYERYRRAWKKAAGAP